MIRVILGDVRRGEEGKSIEGERTAKDKKRDGRGTQSSTAVAIVVERRDRIDVVVTAEPITGV